MGGDVGGVAVAAGGGRDWGIEGGEERIEVVAYNIHVNAAARVVSGDRGAEHFAVHGAREQEDGIADGFGG